MDMNGPEIYATVFALAPSYHDINTIWAGSDDGMIHITRDGGKNWTNITPPDLPKFSRVSIIDESPHSPGTAYVAVNRYQTDDRAPYVYRTRDYGKTWTKIIDGRILPYVELDCNRVRATILPDIEREQAVFREVALGRALARVLAHELRHALARTLTHREHGLARVSLASRDLLYGAYKLDASDLEPLAAVHGLAQRDDPTPAPEVVETAAFSPEIGR